MRRPARIVIAAVVVPGTLLGLVACSAPSPLPMTSRTGSTAPPSASASPRLSVQVAAAVALRRIGAGTVISVEDESDGTVWDVRVVDEGGQAQEMHLSAAGRVLAGPSEDPTDADEQSANRAQVAATSISLAGAAGRMTAAVPRGRVTAIGLGRFQDRVVWRGDVTNARGVRQDVRIDAVNGSVLLNLPDGQQGAGGS